MQRVMDRRQEVAWKLEYHPNKDKGLLRFPGFSNAG